MTKFGSQPLDLQKHQTGHFGFSAKKLDDLGATEYTLVTFVADRSGSTSGFQNEMEAAIKEGLGACFHSPRSDNLMVRYITFDTNHVEDHGFKLLEECKLDDYDNTLPPGGMTALFDATIDGVEGISNYGRDLLEGDFAVNGIIFVVTDGMENSSGIKDVSVVRKALEQAVQGENLESLQSILIGVNITDPTVSASLQDFKDEAGFTKYVELKDANKSTLGKLAQFFSKSISSTSQSLGSGAPASSINF